MAQAPHFGVPPGGVRPPLRPLAQGAGSSAAARPAALHHGMPDMPSVQYATLQQRQMQQHGHVQQQQQLLARQQAAQAQVQQQQQQQQLQQQAQAQAQAQRMQLLHQQQMHQQSQQAQAQSQQAAQAQRGSLGLAAHPSQAAQAAQQLQAAQHQAQHAQAAVAAQQSRQLAHVQAQHAVQQSVQVQQAQAHAVAQQQHAVQLHEAAYAEQQQMLHAHAQQLQQQQQAQQMQQVQHAAAVREANLHAQQAAAASAKMSPEVAAAETRLSQAKERLWLRIGGMRSTFGDADGALEAFQAVLQHNPVNATALTQAATVLAKQEQYNLAENLLQRSLAVQHACGEAWAVLAHCYVMTDQLQPAYLAYQNALSFLPNPKDPTLWYGIGTLRVVVSSFRCISCFCFVVMVCLLLGRCYTLVFDRVSSVSALTCVVWFLRTLFWFSPPTLCCLFWIGLLYDRYGWLNHALEAFKSVLDIAPDFERADEVCFCMGIIFKEQGDYKSALEYFDRVVAAASPPPPLSSADALYQIGLVHDLTGDKPTAEATFRRALEANPSHAKSLNQLAWLRHLAGDAAEALELLDRSVEVDGNDGQVWYLLGRVRMTRREYREAHEAYQKAVFSDSRNHVYWCSIGVLYFQMGQHKDALDAYTRAIRITPNVGDVWLALGRLYETCHQPNDALDAYGRALDLSPGDTAISTRLDLIRNYMETGGPPPALPDPPADGPLAMSAMMAARTAVAFGPGGGPVPGAAVGGVPAPAAGFGALMQSQATSTQANLAPVQALAGRSDGPATAGGADQGDDSDRDAEHQAPALRTVGRQDLSRSGSLHAAGDRGSASANVQQRGPVSAVGEDSDIAPVAANRLPSFAPGSTGPQNDQGPPPGPMQRREVPPPHGMQALLSPMGREYRRPERQEPSRPDASVAAKSFRGSDVDGRGARAPDARRRPESMVDANADIQERLPSLAGSRRGSRSDLRDRTVPPPPSQARRPNHGETEPPMADERASPAVRPEGKQRVDDRNRVRQRRREQPSEGRDAPERVGHGARERSWEEKEAARDQRRRDGGRDGGSKRGRSDGGRAREPVRPAEVGESHSSSSKSSLGQRPVAASALRGRCADVVPSDPTARSLSRLQSLPAAPGRRSPVADADIVAPGTAAAGRVSNATRLTKPSGEVAGADDKVRNVDAPPSYRVKHSGRNASRPAELSAADAAAREDAPERARRTSSGAADDSMTSSQRSGLSALLLFGTSSRRGGRSPTRGPISPPKTTTEHAQAADSDDEDEEDTPLMERQRQRHNKQQGHLPERRVPPVEPAALRMDPNGSGRSPPVMEKAFGVGRLSGGTGVKPISPGHSRDVSPRSGAASPRQASGVAPSSKDSLDRGISVEPFRPGGVPAKVSSGQTVLAEPSGRAKGKGVEPPSVAVAVPPKRMMGGPTAADGSRAKAALPSKPAHPRRKSRSPTQPTDKQPSGNDDRLDDTPGAAFKQSTEMSLAEAPPSAPESPRRRRRPVSPPQSPAMRPTDEAHRKDQAAPSSAEKSALGSADMDDSETHDASADGAGAAEADDMDVERSPSSPASAEGPAVRPAKATSPATSPTADATGPPAMESSVRSPRAAKLKDATAATPKRTSTSPPKRKASSPAAATPSSLKRSSSPPSHAAGVMPLSKMSRSSSSPAREAGEMVMSPEKGAALTDKEATSAVQTASIGKTVLRGPISPPKSDGSEVGSPDKVTCHAPSESASKAAPELHASPLATGSLADRPPTKRRSPPRSPLQEAVRTPSPRAGPADVAPKANGRLEKSSASPPSGADEVASAVPVAKNSSSPKAKSSTDTALGVTVGGTPGAKGAVKTGGHAPKESLLSKARSSADPAPGAGALATPEASKVGVPDDQTDAPDGISAKAVAESTKADGPAVSKSAGAAVDGTVPDEPSTSSPTDGRLTEIRPEGTNAGSAARSLAPPLPPLPPARKSMTSTLRPVRSPGSSKNAPAIKTPSLLLGASLPASSATPATPIKRATPPPWWEAPSGGKSKGTGAKGGGLGFAGRAAGDSKDAADGDAAKTSAPVRADDGKDSSSGGSSRPRPSPSSRTTMAPPAPKAPLPPLTSGDGGSERGHKRVRSNDGETSGKWRDAPVAKKRPSGDRESGSAHGDASVSKDRSGDASAATGGSPTRDGRASPSGSQRDTPSMSNKPSSPSMRGASPRSPRRDGRRDSDRSRDRDRDRGDRDGRSRHRYGSDRPSHSSRRDRGRGERVTKGDADP